MAYNKETGMWEGYVYCITNQVNGKQYIGQTINKLSKRWREHKCASKTSEKYLYTSMRKYGLDNFSIHKIEMVCESSNILLVDRLNALEIKNIIEKHTLSPNGYNLTKGGDSIYEKRRQVVYQFDFDSNFIKEFESIRDACKAVGGASSSKISEACRGIQNQAYGFLWTLDKNKTPLKKDSKSNKKVDQYDLDFNYIQTFKSMIEAASAMGVKGSGSIANSCVGKQKQAYGFIWRYQGDTRANVYTPAKGSKTKVDVYDRDGILLGTFPSLQKAAKKYGVLGSSITSCCKGRRSCVHDYIFRYHGEDFYKYKLPKISPTIMQFSKEGCFLYEYKSALEASEAIGVSRNVIWEALTGGNITGGGYIWRYCGDALDKYPLPPKTTIFQLYKDDELVEEFKTVVEASEYADVSTGTIYNSINNMMKTRKGLEFRIVN